MAVVPTQLRQIREDKRLIGLVRKYRLIYDPRHGDYKDVELKEEAWQDIADRLARQRRRLLQTPSLELGLVMSQEESARLASLCMNVLPVV
ncbi:unnamed protein product [Timema podura]|uniref:MADF domain-containing protein n=1 Tax=Timema podura TaxID=61482 RepID=A0ABN7NZZ6_TIMPD|nr:unnamed protein product [Timema podura]